MAKYLCVRGVDFAFVYYFSVGCWTCSDNVVLLFCMLMNAYIDILPYLYKQIQGYIEDTLFVFMVFVFQVSVQLKFVITNLNFKMPLYFSATFVK